MLQLNHSLHSQCLSSQAENQHKPLLVSASTASLPKSNTPIKTGSVITTHRSIAFRSKSRIPEPEDEEDNETTHVLAQPSLQASRGTIIGNKFEHKWTKESKILCRLVFKMPLAIDVHGKGQYIVLTKYHLHVKSIS